MQSFGDSRLAVFALRIAQESQFVGITLALQNRGDNTLAGHASDIGDHLGQLDIHLFESLLHVLRVTGRITNLHLSLPMIGTQSHDRIRRPERRLQQTIRVQSLDPLNVEHVSLGASAAA